MKRRKRKKRQYELRRLKRLGIRKKRDKKYNPNKNSSSDIFQITAPSDFRLLQNTEKCVEFFSLLRSMKKAKLIESGDLHQRINLSNIKHIDFASTVVLDAICKEMKELTPSCFCSGSSPYDKKCRAYLVASGFFNDKVDENGKPFEKSSESEKMKIERGQTRLTAEHIKRVVDIETHACKHLINTEKKCYERISIIKEICGNTVGWSNAFNHQWTLGAKFEKDKVIFVALDLGQGILETLKRRFLKLVEDILVNNTDKEVLEGAFLKKYGSASGENNRNRGLPSIKAGYDKGFLKELAVLSNNVLLDFSDNQNSRIIASKKSQSFNGTLYSWIIDSSCYK